MLAFLCLAFCLLTRVPRVTLSYTCTDPDLLKSVLIRQKLDGDKIHTFYPSGLMICARECIYHTNCLSFNFQTLTRRCELNRRKAHVSNPLISTHNYLYGEKSSWFYGISETCQQTSCPENNKCDPGAKKVNGTRCILVDCGVPPVIEFAYNLRYDGTIIGYTANYTCLGVEVFYEDISLTCSTNGTWEGANCRKVSSCRDVQLCNSNYTDGEYWLYPETFGNRERVKIYCHGLNTTKPTTFVTLPHENRITSPTLFVEKLASCTTIISTNHKIGDSIFHKIQISLDNMGINITSFEFSDLIYGAYQVYGRTIDCTTRVGSCEHLPRSHMILDTTDTGLIIDRNATWVIHGWKSGIPYFNRSSDTVIELYSHGYCGGSKPASPLTLTLDPNSVMEDELATIVGCLP